MKVLSITAFAFLALLFCLLNLFTLVVSNNNLPDLYNNATHFTKDQEQRPITVGNYEPGSYLNPLINNNFTTGFDPMSSALLPHENKTINGKLTDARVLGNITVTETDFPSKILTVQSYYNDESVNNFTMPFYPKIDFSASPNYLPRSNNTQQMRDSILECISKSLEFRLHYLHNLSVLKLNSNNISDYESIINETLTHAENLYKEKVEPLTEELQAFKKKFCVEIIENARNYFAMELDRSLQEALQSLDQDEQRRNPELSLEYFFNTILHHTNIKKKMIQAVNIPESCKNENDDLITDVILTDKKLITRLFANFKKFQFNLVELHDWDKIELLQEEYTNFLLSMQINHR